MKTFINHGLTNQAKDYLKTYSAKVIGYENVEYWYHIEVQFKTYILDSDKIIKEVEQLCVWSGGPKLFVCLQDESGKQYFKWDDKDIDNV